MPVQAQVPVVCTSASGHAALTNFDLNACGVPVGITALVEMRVASDPFGSAQMSLTEGAQSCSLFIPPNDQASCYLSVSDGVLDAASTSLNAPQNYQILVTWASTSTDSVYQTTLESGAFFNTRREFTYGDIVTATLLFFLILLSLLFIVLFVLEPNR